MEFAIIGEESGRRLDMYLKRNVYKRLIEWKNSVDHSTLEVNGARQVGKTHSVLTFGKKEYENVAYFNFETDIRLKETFEENITPEYLIPILSRISSQTIIKEKTFSLMSIRDEGEGK